VAQRLWRIDEVFASFSGGRLIRSPSSAPWFSAPEAAPVQHCQAAGAHPFSTVARALHRLGLRRLRSLEPKPPVQRYERETPGDLIHIDLKKLAGFWVTGSRVAPPALATTVSMWQSTTPPVWPTWSCWRMSSSPQPSALTNAVAWFNC
jgi:hypothetical protein